MCAFGGSFSSPKGLEQGPVTYGSTLLEGLQRNGVAHSS